MMMMMMNFLPHDQFVFSAVENSRPLSEIVEEFDSPSEAEDEDYDEKSSVEEVLKAEEDEDRDEEIIKAEEDEDHNKEVVKADEDEDHDEEIIKAEEDEDHNEEVVKADEDEDHNEEIIKVVLVCLTDARVMK